MMFHDAVWTFHLYLHTENKKYIIFIYGWQVYKHTINSVIETENNAKLNRSATFGLVLCWNTRKYESSKTP